MDLLDLAHRLEQLVSLGILLVAGLLTWVGWQAWRRDREPRMRTVTVAYALFALFGLLVFIEPTVTRTVSYPVAELIENGAGLFVLAGLVVFFAAIARDRA